MDDLERLVGAEHVHREAVVGDVAVPGGAATLVLPGSADEVAAVVGLVLRARRRDRAASAGGSGLAGGPRSLDPDAVAIALDRLDRGALASTPGCGGWRPRPGSRRRRSRAARARAACSSRPTPARPSSPSSAATIATNAGGPHAFKYGVTGDWVTGLEVVLAPGELVRVGGPVRKDVAGYDLRRLLVGSEGTLGIVTAAWLRLVPAPEAQLPVVAAYPSRPRAARRSSACWPPGSCPPALEYLDVATMRAAGGAFPGGPLRGFVVLAEADGSAAEAARVRDELREALAEGRERIYAPQQVGAIARAVALARGRLARGDGARAARSSPRTSRSRSTVCRGDRRRRSRSARATSSTPAPGGTRATATSTRRSCSTRRRRREPGRAQMAPRSSSSTSRARLGGTRHRRARHRRAEGRPARAAVGAGGGRARTRAIKAALDPKGLLNPGKKEP